MRGRISFCVVGLLACDVGLGPSANALPSYARQTGLPCSGCPTTALELNNGGRLIKLLGYTDRAQNTSITAESTTRRASLNLLQNLPLSVFLETSMTSTKVPQPATQNWNFEFPQDVSLFLAGAWATHVGSFLQIAVDSGVGLRVAEESTGAMARDGRTKPEPQRRGCPRADGFPDIAEGSHWAGSEAMMRRFTASMTFETSATMVLLSFAALAGCKHSAPANAGLKATAQGTALVESSGGHQVGATGTALKDPLVVQVNDDHGTAVPGALVEFHGSAGVSFDPAAVLTDASGQATTSITLGAIAGRYEWSAVTPGKNKAVPLEIVETALGYQQRVGSVLADKYCSRCHDSESSPERVSNYDNLEVKPHPFTDGSTLNKMTDADLTSIILHGGPALNRSALMPLNGNTLSAADVKALIAYARAVSDPSYQQAGTVYAGPNL